MDATVLIVIALLTLVLVLSFLRRRTTENFLPMLPIHKPKLYWFVDAESNTRKWWDFQGRRSATPNRGYLEVALEAVQKSQGEKFEIVPLIGRMETLLALEHPHARAIDLPPALWRSYIISALCTQRGGLVIDGNSVLTVGPSFQLEGVQAAVFGTDHDEPVAGGSKPGPDGFLGYASAAGHPAWAFTLREYEKLLTAGPQAWSSAVARRLPMQLWETQQVLGMKVLRDADGSRYPDGHLRQLEDYFGRLTTATDTTLPAQAVYVAYDGDALERRYEFNWFLRLSSKDIQSSELVWSKYAGL